MVFKRRYIALAVLFLSAGILAWQLFNNSHIDDANKNMDMGGFKLLIKEDAVKGLLDKKFVPVGGFGCKPYKSIDESTEVVFSGFPDVLDDYKLTGISAADSRCHFYGMRVGDNVEASAEILDKNGFIKQDTGSVNGDTGFKKGKLIVVLTTDSESKITRISIRLESTNKKKVVF